MGVSVEIEATEIRDRFGRTASPHLAHPHESPEPLGDFNVHQMR